MDSLSALNVFVQVAETRSFVAAGRILGVSASAIGKRIGQLEDELGVRLFHRSTRSITLTAEGGLFLARCRRILGEVESARQELSDAGGAPRGRLRLSLPLIADPFLPALADFKQAYPAIELDLDFNDRRVDIVDEGYDAVFRSGESEDSRLTARRIGGYRMMIVGAPAYLEKHAPPLAPADVARHACIRFRYPNTGKMQTWPAEVEAALASPAAIVCNNLEARVAFALRGLGLAYLPDFAIAAHLAAGRLVQVLPAQVETGVFRILWPASRHLPPKLRALIDFFGQRPF